MQTKQASIAQRSRKMVHFDHKDMDYYYSWILGRAVYEGADPGECLETALHIVDGDPASWQKEWKQLAGRVEAQADSALRSGDPQQARKAYLRACTYYRRPLFIMLPTEAAFLENWRKMHECFQKAASLFDRPIESIQVSYQGQSLQGYFCKVDGSGQ